MYLVYFMLCMHSSAPFYFHYQHILYLFYSKDLENVLTLPKAAVFHYIDIH